MFYECRKQGYDRINITSDNVDDQTGTFSYKFTQYPSIDFIFPPISISSTDAYVSISATNIGNGIINLERIYPPHEIILVIHAQKLKQTHLQMQHLKTK